ncbi:hypothetical protein P8452_46066 [Trifolium repens]|nr:hypothetical protein P8452_46066 [Trifolium repens]
MAKCSIQVLVLEFSMDLQLICSSNPGWDLNGNMYNFQNNAEPRTTWESLSPSKLTLTVRNKTVIPRQNAMDKCQIKFDSKER